MLAAVFSVLLCGGAAVAGALLLAHNAEPDGGSSPVASTPAERDPPESAEPSTTASPTGTRTVRYEISGTGTATIIYSRPDNRRVAPVIGETLPWQVEVSAPADRIFVASVIATRAEGSGELRCRILLDGQEIYQRRQSGNGRSGTIFCGSVIEP